MHSWVNKIHFIGVGGTGMCGIAEVLFNLNYKVSGSDATEGANTRRLKKLGLDIHIGHKPELVKGVDVVVVSSAISDSNPEVVAAREQKVPVVPRAEMLGELMRLQRGIAVAGTHGKTTTTSLIASLLAAGGLDPTFVIGGRLNSAGTNARLGKGEYFVAEADESDASFTHLDPFIAVVTNIDADHMETYHGDFEELKRAFLEFLHNLPFYGLAVMCIDDPVIREILPDIHKPILTYGLSEDADVRGTKLKQDGSRMHFTVSLKDKPDWLDVTINQPGEHSVLNSLAAVAVANVLEIDGKEITKAFKKFEGIGRRLQMNGEIKRGDGKIIFIDDYAHHPTEIQATVSAIQGGWPGQRLVVVFQPHRYTRTRDLMEDFAEVLSNLETLVITEVYAAGENPIAGADGRSLCKAIRVRGRANPIFVEQVEELPDVLNHILLANDVVLTMGAGNIGLVAADLPQVLAEAANA